jgi:RNA polymerase sigma factor (TIGR02999 family)
MLRSGVGWRPTGYLVRMADVTQILNAIDAGDPQAADQLMPLVYDELRQLAARRLAHESPGQTLQPTALVHEAYLRLIGPTDRQSWSNRRHFFAAAAEAMRRILVESARRKNTGKRGAGLVRRDVEVVDVAAPETPEEVLDLDEALTGLAATDPQAAELVRLRFFAGLPLPEVARLIGIAPRTADRLWAYARAWLHQELRGEVERADNS